MAVVCIDNDWRSSYCAVKSLTHVHPMRAVFFISELCDRSSWRAGAALPSLYLAILILFQPALLSQLTAQELAIQTTELMQELQRYETQLEDYEFEYGFLDPRLLEPLLSIESLYQSLGDYEQVKSIQNRRLQITRTAVGLTHPDTVPLVEALVRTEMRLANWEQVSDHLEHLRTLAVANHGLDSEQAMLAQERQASWFMTRVYVDSDRERADNFMEAREIFRDLLISAQAKYDEDDVRLVPWLNKRAYSLYLLVAGLNADSSVVTNWIRETAQRDGPARLETPRARGFNSPFSVGGFNQVIPITEGDEPVGVAYLRQANGFINDIAEIAQANDDAEMAAMARLYHGDYAYLQGRSVGRQDYQEAKKMLIEVGIDEARLEAFFNRPMIIPVPIFFTRFGELEAFQQETVVNQLLAESELNADSDPWDQPLHLGSFRAWERGLAFVPMPVSDDELLALEAPIYSIDAKFRITSSGRVSGVRVLTMEPEDRRARRRAVRAMRMLQFRPALYGTRARARDHVELRYQITNESES